MWLGLNMVFFRWVGMTDWSVLVFTGKIVAVTRRGLYSVILVLFYWVSDFPPVGWLFI